MGRSPLANDCTARYTGDNANVLRVLKRSCHGLTPGRTSASPYPIMIARFAERTRDGKGILDRISRY
jgi:hypothetical protein